MEETTMIALLFGGNGTTMWVATCDGIATQDIVACVAIGGNGITMWAIVGDRIATQDIVASDGVV